MTVTTDTRKRGRTEQPAWPRRTVFGAGRPFLVSMLTVVLGFRAGGFYPGVTGLVALALMLGLALRVLVAPRPFAGWSGGLALAAGALALYGAWTLGSLIWSDAPARALVEFDRVLLYLLVLVVCGLAVTRRGDLSRLVWGVAAALSVICVAGLLSRLLPDVIDASPNIVAERLSFPLTYWNAMGIAAAVALVLLTHLTASGAEPRVVRVVAAALMPAVAVTLFLTFSRGAIWVAPVGLVLYGLIALPRGLLTAVPAVGLPTAAAVYAAYGADALSRDNYATAPAAIDQGHELLVIVVACMAAAVLLRTLGLIVDARVGRIRLSGGRVRAVRGSAVVATVVALGVGAFAADAPARIDTIRDTWSHGTFLQTTDLRDRLLSVSDNGRVTHWRVATETFADHPLLGTGAGTFRLDWEQRRQVTFQVNDAHSLYLEVASELGVPGVALVVLALGTVLFGAVRRLRGPERHVHAAVLAAGVVLLIHAAVDWDWEMPALFLWLFAAGGLMLAAREGRERGPVPGRLGRVLGGLACLLVALTPWLLATSQGPLNDAVRAFHRGDCATAVDRALTSAERLSVRPEPFEVVGWCDVRAGQGRLAVNAMTAARDRDPDNWAYAYGLAVAQAVDGQDPRALAALATRLNPREPLARDFAKRTRATDSRARWRRIAQRAQPPT
jgi:O-Antigen ligase